MGSAGEVSAVTISKAGAKSWGGLNGGFMVISWDFIGDLMGKWIFMVLSGFSGF